MTSSTSFGDTLFNEGVRTAEQKAPLLCQLPSREAFFAYAANILALNSNSTIWATTISSPVSEAIATLPHATSHSFSPTNQCTTMSPLRSSKVLFG